MFQLGDCRCLRFAAPLLVAGRINKQIAHDISVSEITVKVHRGQVMRKMKAASLPDLARMADKLNFTREKS
jgi:FixJ family two-component response regulator